MHIHRCDLHKNKRPEYSNPRLFAGFQGKGNANRNSLHYKLRTMRKSIVSKTNQGHAAHGNDKESSHIPLDGPSNCPSLAGQTFISLKDICRELHVTDLDGATAG